MKARVKVSTFLLGGLLGLPEGTRIVDTRHDIDNDAVTFYLIGDNGCSECDGWPLKGIDEL